MKHYEISMDTLHHCHQGGKLVPFEEADRKEIALKVLEEAAELVEACKYSLKHPESSKEHIEEEVGDVLMSCLCVADAFDIDIDKAAGSCKKRNEKRGRI